MKPIIRVENLSKQYRIGAQQASYTTLRDSLTNAITAPFRRFKNPQSATRNPQSDTIWALKNVSFEVMPGEVVGIIGRNGAGKSTLLKILSRITEPTTGRVDLYGRVGSLLEVGTGFHPELTGRENVFLNGAVLGMKRVEINRHFDEIVDFAEVEKFLDTPVKFYSSGMYMRLAFAVAAHLDPEILAVDEVLAVGDASFQKKCINKMGSVAAEGRTVIFVSHSMPVISQLCSRGVLLRQGSLVEAGEVDEIIDLYLDDTRIENEKIFAATSATAAWIQRLCILDEEGKKISRIPHSKPFTTEIEYIVETPLSSDCLWWQLSRNDGVEVMGSAEIDHLARIEEITKPGRYIATVRFPGGILNAGRYQYRVALASKSGHVCDYKYGNYFEIYDDTDYGAVNSGGKRNGVIMMRLQWANRRVS